MTDIRTVSETFSVSPQLSLDDLAAAAGMGFNTIINNRPDGEAVDQPSSQDVAAAAEVAGMAYRYLPIVPGQVSESDIREFSDAIAALPRPVLAFCRTGARSITLYCLAEATRQNPGALLEMASAAGFDLGPLRERLEMRAAAKSYR